MAPESLKSQKTKHLRVKFSLDQNLGMKALLFFYMTMIFFRSRTERTIFHYIIRTDKT